ncbi:MAG: DUF1464 family protein [Gemmatimonadota bacterium]
MPRVIGMDPGTVGLDVVGLDEGELTFETSLATAEALAHPDRLVAALLERGRPDLIAGPSGYGLPLRRGADLTERDLRLALLAAPGEDGGIGGLGRLLRLLVETGVPLVFLPGVIHLRSVPRQRKLNRVDLGTADKVCVAALAIHDQHRRLGIDYAATSFILLELGGAFTAALAVDGGRIVDGIGGTAGPMGWHSSGAWDGEVAFLAGSVSKRMLFQGGVETLAAQDDYAIAREAYVEGAVKAALQLTASVRSPREIVLSGRHAADQAIAGKLEERLAHVAPAVRLAGFGRRAREGAHGAALIADGLAGGGFAPLVKTMGLETASGTVLDHLHVIPRDAALRRLGL